MPSFNFEEIKAQEGPFLSREQIIDREAQELSPDGRLIAYPTDCYESSSGFYAIYVFATTPSARRVIIKISDVYPSFTVERKMDLLWELVSALAAERIEIEDPGSLPARRVKAGKGYTEEEFEVVDLAFWSVGARSKAISKARELGLRTFSDGSPWSYLNIFLTESLLTMADWWLVRCGEGSPMKNGRILCYTVSKNDISCRSVPLDLEPPDPMFRDISLPQAPPTLSLSWDIETYNHCDGPISDGSHVEDVIFMIAGGIGWSHQGEPLLSYCIVSCPYARDHFRDDGTIVIYTENEKDILRAFAWINERVLPEYRIAFNNYLFDDPYFCRRGNEIGHIFHELMETMVPFDLEVLIGNRKGVSLPSLLTKKTSIKKEAGITEEVRYLYIPGSINVDMAQCIPKLQTKKQEILESKALASYLIHYNLPNKLDVTAPEMFEFFRGADGEGIARVMEYCIVDGLSCQRLQNSSSAISQFSALAHTSFCSVSDAMNKANSEKVKNNIYALGRRQGYVYTEEHEAPTGKYPGAEVLPPVTGIHKEVPIFALDFASLYPSIIRSLNMSSETYVKDAATIENLKQRGYEVYTYDWGDGRASFVRKYPDGTPFPSIYGTCLTKYLDTRNKFKALIKVAEKALEKETDPIARKNLSLSLSEYDNNQKAVKILMNTFYGVLGQKMFPLCEIAMSSCICMFGRKCLNIAKTAAEREGCRTIYGDTDSIFVAPPLAKDEVPVMLRGATAIAESLLKIINGVIAEETGNNLIRMEYDKLLYPMVLLSKKQYYGTAWDPVKATMKPDNPYVSGLPFKKRGKTQALKDASQRVVDKSLDLSCTENIVDIAISVLHEARDEISTRPVEDLVRKARMNPGKGGNANKFAARMAERYRIAELAGDEESMRLFRPPKGGEYFEYIVCERGGMYEFMREIPSRCGTCQDCLLKKPCFRCRKCRLGGLCQEAIAGQSCTLSPCCIARVTGRVRCGTCKAELGKGKVTGMIKNRCQECNSARETWCDECKSPGSSSLCKKRDLGVTDRWEYKDVFLEQRLVPDYQYYISDIIKSLARFISNEMELPADVAAKHESDEKALDAKRMNLAIKMLEEEARDAAEKLGMNNPGKKKAMEVMSKYRGFLSYLGITFSNMYHMSHSHASLGSATIFMKIIAASADTDGDLTSITEARNKLSNLREKLVSNYDLVAMYRAFLSDMLAAEAQRDGNGLEEIKEKVKPRGLDELHFLFSEATKCKVALRGAAPAPVPAAPSPGVSARVLRDWIDTPSRIVSYPL